MPTPLEKCFAPARLNGLELRNRVLKAATFEGMTRGGLPSDELIEFHRAIADGGAAMTTVAYCSVEPDGRLHDQMLYMHEGIRPQLERLTATVHRAGAAISGQMGHCGNFTKNRSLRRKRPLGPSRAFNTLGFAYGMAFAGEMRKRHIDRMVADYRDAAVFMKSVGFDALEIHFSHGYGLSQFISPKTNRRTDEYGGSLTNRMRLPLRVLEAVREAVGDEFPLLGKMGLTDGVKGGLLEDEAIEVAALLDQGGIDALIPSGGTSSMNPMWLFRGDSILPGLLEVERNPIMRLALRVAGKRMLRSYPYEELYFLDGARRVRDRVRCKVAYVGGVSTMKSLETVMREFDFVQLGRALVKDPALVRNAEADARYVNGCNHCNLCATLIEHPNGIRCVLNDRE